MTVNTLFRLSWNTDLFRSVHAGFAAGVQEEAFPAYRNPPTGDEQVAWVGPTIAPLGFVTFYEVGQKRLWLDLLFVQPHSRREGHGHKLVEEVRLFAERHGFERIEFGTGYGHSAMQSLGWSKGFTETGILMSVDLATQAAAVAAGIDSDLPY